MAHEVVGTRDDRAVPNEDGSDRDLVPVPRQPRLVQGELHEALVLEGGLRVTRAVVLGVERAGHLKRAVVTGLPARPGPPGPQAGESRLGGSWYTREDSNL